MQKAAGLSSSKTPLLKCFLPACFLASASLHCTLTYSLGYRADVDVYLTKPARKELLLQLIYNFVRGQEKIHQQILNSNNFFPNDVALNKVDEDSLNQVIGVIEANLSDPDLDHKVLCNETALSRTVNPSGTAQTTFP